jgi:hypothetical protein
MAAAVSGVPAPICRVADDALRYQITPLLGLEDRVRLSRVCRRMWAFYDAIKDRLTHLVWVGKAARFTLPPDDRVRSIVVRGDANEEGAEFTGRILTRFPHVVAIDMRGLVNADPRCCDHLFRKFVLERKRLEQLVLPRFYASVGLLDHVEALLKHIDPSQLRVLDAKECLPLNIPCDALFDNLTKAQKLQKLYLPVYGLNIMEYLRSLPPQVGNIHFPGQMIPRAWDQLLLRLQSHSIHTVDLNLIGRDQGPRTAATIAGLGPFLPSMKNVKLCLDCEEEVSEGLAQRLGESKCLETFALTGHIVMKKSVRHFLTHLRQIPTLREVQFRARLELSPRLMAADDAAIIGLILQFPERVTFLVNDSKIPWKDIAEELFLLHGSTVYTPVWLAILRKHALEKRITSQEIESLSQRYPDANEYVRELYTLLAGEQLRG